jgi:class 3 adenylate cyclase
LFTDIEGWTRLAQQLGDQRAHRLLQEHDRILTDCVAHHRGHAVKHMGDAFMAALIAGLGRTPPSAGDLLATGPGTSTPWPSDDALRFALDLANECGALAVTAVGATISFRSLPRATYPALHQWRNSDQ